MKEYKTSTNANESSPHNESQSHKRFGLKPDVAALVPCCLRSVDNLMVEGLPHLKIGRRTVRFDLDEVADWLKRKYSVSRIGGQGV